MDLKELIQNMERAVIHGEVEETKQWAVRAIENNLDILAIVNEGLIKSIKKVGDQFGNGEIFLPDLILSSEAMKSASDILEEELKKSGRSYSATVGTLVIGTVKGDIHDIGKTLVSTLFKAAGFMVIDLGVDVPKETFIEAVKQYKPDLLGLSSLLTTGAREQKSVVEMLRASGVRSEVKIMVGGGAITEQWALEIGADAYGGDAREAVEKGTHLLLNA